MSAIDTCRRSLSQDIQNLTAGKPPKEWVSVLQASKPGHLVKLYESTVTFDVREVAEEAFAKLSHIKLKDEHKKRVKAAHTLFQKKVAKVESATPPKLFTAQVTKEKDISRLKDIVKTWNRLAKTKENTAKRLEKHDGSFQKGGLAYDSKAMTGIVKDIDRKKPEKNEFVYVAFDERKKVQALALVDYSKKSGFELLDLVANPENVIVFDHEKADCRGAGTALIRHIVQDIFNGDKEKKKLSLFSLASAEPFYEKLGFTRVVGNPEVDFKLKKKEMANFLNKLPATATIAKKVPKFVE